MAKSNYHFMDRSKTKSGKNRTVMPVNKGIDTFYLAMRSVEEILDNNMTTDKAIVLQELGGDKDRVKVRRIFRPATIGAVVNKYLATRNEDGRSRWHGRSSAAI